MNIPGLKSLRLLVGQPTVLLPRGGVDLSQLKNYFMELTLDSGAVLNIPITKYSHDEFMKLMAAQGTPFEQRVSARAEQTSENDHTAPKENFIEVVGPVDVESEIRKALGISPPPYESPLLLPADQTRDP